MANGSNIRSAEREQRNRSAFSGHELYLKCRATSVAMRHCPYVAFLQPVFFDVAGEDDRI